MKKIVRDPIHGDIEITGLQRECLDTPQIQRLRGIRQLGTAYLVYPGAQHTRFEHSLGTLHMARRILDALVDAGGLRIDPDLREIIGVAALLHDVGHIPFGHTLEDERRVFPRHDDDRDRWRFFFESDELGGVLERAGIQREVAGCLVGDEEGGVPRYASQVVRDTVCADLLDYLRRDAYYCGLSQRYDDRVFRSFRWEGDGLFFELFKNGLFRHDALSEIVNLLRLRYTLSERVYYHHTKISSGAMISKAVELALSRDLTKKELYQLKDESLLYLLRTRFARNRGVKTLVQRLESRRIYKPVYLISPSVGVDRQADLVGRFHLNENQERETTERLIAKELGVRPEAVILYCPALGMALKEADVPVRADGRKLVSLATLRNPEIEVLKEKHRHLWRFYVLLDPESGDHFDRASEVCESIFRSPNELPKVRTGRLEA